MTRGVRIYAPLPFIGICAFMPDDASIFRLSSASPYLYCSLLSPLPLSPFYTHTPYKSIDHIRCSPCASLSLAIIHTSPPIPSYRPYLEEQTGTKMSERGREA